ncbi:Transcription factor Sox-2 [Sarracenia purpurea var. burkii]
MEPRPATKDGPGKSQNAQFRDLETFRRRMEIAQRTREKAVHRRSEKTTRRTHEGAPRLQIQTQKKNENVAEERQIPIRHGSLLSQTNPAGEPRINTSSASTCQVVGRDTNMYHHQMSNGYLPNGYVMHHDAASSYQQHHAAAAYNSHLSAAASAGYRYEMPQMHPNLASSNYVNGVTYPGMYSSEVAHLPVNPGSPYHSQLTGPPHSPQSGSSDKTEPVSPGSTGIHTPTTYY